MANMAELQKLIRKRGALKAKLTTFSQFVKEIDDVIESLDHTKLASLYSELRERVNKFETVWPTFNEHQDSIEELAENFEEQLEERRLFENQYFKIIARATCLLKKKEESEQDVDNISLGSARTLASSPDIRSSKCNIKLPQIKLPEFNGTYEKWLEFKDTFQSLVHENENISEIEKFHYLRSSLHSTAAQVIRSVEFSAANYSLAWDLLCDRFNNKSVLISTHINALFNLTQMSKENANEYRSMVDQVTKHVKSLNILGLPTESWDMLVIHLVTMKLDKLTTKEWEQRKKLDELPTLDEMKDFLKQKADLLENLELSKGQKPKVEIKPFNQNQKIKSFVTSEVKCPLCKENHLLYSCNTFITNYIPDSRYKLVRKLNVCINCLRSGHRVAECKSGRCKHCNMAHHSLLHRNNEDQKPNEKMVSSSTEENTLACTSTSKSQVVLSTAVIQVQDVNGKFRNCRALLDNGSQSHFISEACCSKLGLKKNSSKSFVVGIGQTASPVTHTCHVKFKSMHNNYSANIECLVIDKLCDDIPNYSFDISSFQIPTHIKLADPKCNEPGSIDIILGASIFWKLLSVGQHHLNKNGPILHKTVLGWILTGALNLNNGTRMVSCNLVKSIEMQLEKFWEVEEITQDSSYRNQSLDERRCEEHFQLTTKRTNEGRFLLDIPLKLSPDILGESYGQAEQRLQAMERKFSKNPSFKNSYCQFMNEYIELEHMTKVEDPLCDHNRVYLPHHGVINDSSVSTKLRVVFDGSCKTTSGYSLNDIQYIGPQLQEDLLSIILRFRQHSIIICADIQKMYRQMLINPDQRHLQSILWRFNNKDPIDTYELNTVTYGTSSAPYLATKCLTQLGIECKDVYPEASKIICSDFYVDDLITGGETFEKLVPVIQDVIKVLHSGGFKLTKWYSNEFNILKELKVETDSHPLQLGVVEHAKTLGLFWTNEDDSFFYKINIVERKQVTKRTILSDVSQIFDPMGLLAPCIIVAKVILQKLWMSKLSWDESIPQHIYTKWKTFCHQLAILNNLRVPRQITCIKPIFLELHGFADASQDAYGCCLYMRSMNELGEYQVNLIIAKTRVAPVKMLTIPRLELCAAHLLAQLVSKVKSAFTLPINNIVLWSDSMIVLQWINTPANTLQVFVGNRVSQIQSMTSPSNWKHIPSSQNPADLLSRGMTPEDILKNNLWWHGPSFLKTDLEDWPEIKLEFSGLAPETRKSEIVMVVQKPKDIDIFSVSNFSSLNKLVRTVAYCLRFLKNCRPKHEVRVVGPITTTEYSLALQTLVKLSQQDIFKAEFHCLMKGALIPSSSKLHKLNPFIDKNKLIRLGGRLEESSCTFEKKHPILLGKSHLTTLILRNEHSRLGHAGLYYTLSSIRETYWPLSARTTLKRIIHSCVRCFKTKPKPMKVQMGNLPQERTSFSWPFQNTGVDYAGPFFTKTSEGRGTKLQKSYICIFICMSTKAIHLELVTSLSMEYFMATFRRFVSRRGRPSSMHSDNATNFTAANKELIELSKFLNHHEREIAQSLATDGITWKFIPPRAPHFGGLWESGVKLVKNHLVRMIGKTHLSYELFSTILTQVEAILNSRPLVPLSSDPNDLQALTPAHFLIGRRLTALPDPNLSSIPENRLSKFQFIQHIQQQFWKRWCREYLNELQVRTKWNKSTSSLHEGSLVIVKDDLQHPLHWQLGRVTEIFPGRDGATRVANIKVANGIIKRAFSKICPLPINDSEGACAVSVSEG